MNAIFHKYNHFVANILLTSVRKPGYNRSMDRFFYCFIYPGFIIRLEVFFRCHPANNVRN